MALGTCLGPFAETCMEHMKFVDSDMLDELQAVHETYVTDPHDSTLLENIEKPA